MFLKERKKGIITVFLLLLTAFAAISLSFVSAKYVKRFPATGTYVQVSLKLDPNYSGAAASQWRTVTPVSGQAMPSVTPPTRTDYYFTGYYTADGSSGHVQDDSNRYYTKTGASNKNWDASANVLYAGWGKPFKITFDATANGGSITSGSGQLYAMNGESVLYTDWTVSTVTSAPAAARTGFRFEGWFTAATGGTKKIDADGNILSPWAGLTDDSTKLYAQYSAYMITFDATTNGGSIVTGTSPLYAANGATTLYTQKTASVTATAPTAAYYDTDHYYFDGWYTAATDGTRKIDYNGTVLSNWSGLTDDSTILYAQYKPYTYVVTFDKNEPTGRTITGTTADWSMAYGQTAQELSANGYSGTGCTFLGWMTDPDGTVIQFTDSQPVTVAQLISAGAVVTDDADRTKKDITLYAKYAISYKVTFINMADGTGTDVVAEYYTKKGISQLYANPDLTGPVAIPGASKGIRANVKAWSTSSDGGTVVINDNNGAAAIVGGVPGYTDGSGNWATDTWAPGGITLYCVWFTVNYYKSSTALGNGYTELEYIASTNGGGQGINTGYIPKNHALGNAYYLKLEFAMRPTNLSGTGTKYFYRCGTGNNSRCNFNANGLTGSFEAGKTTGINSHALVNNTKYTYMVDYDSGVFIIVSFKRSLHTVRDGVDLGTSEYSNNSLGDSNLPLTIFKGGSSDTPAAVRIYYFNMYDGSDRADDVSKYVPAFDDSTGTTGFYDTVQGTFSSSTSGAFITEFYNQDFAYGETAGTLNGYVVSGNAADGCPKEGYTKSGSSIAGWSFDKMSSTVWYSNGASVNPTADLWSHKVTQRGAYQVNFYTVWSGSKKLQSVFHNMNSDTEYYYMAPLDEDGNIIEEENVNE